MLKNAIEVVGTVIVIMLCLCIMLAIWYGATLFVSWIMSPTDWTGKKKEKKKMTNAEKFKEVFGHDVETNACPRKDVECEKCELFNDRTCTETFWNSEYTPPTNQIEPVRAYPCNPEKNTDCKKTGCYERGGPCKLTLNPEYAKEERDEHNMR